MNLAPQCSFRAEKQILGQLLCQGGAALHDVVGPGVCHHGAHCALKVETKVVEETSILSCQNRIDDMRGNFFQRNGIVPDECRAVR